MSIESALKNLIIEKYGSILAFSRVQLLQEYLNLNEEILIINWTIDNYGIKRRVSLVRKS